MDRIIDPKVREMKSITGLQENPEENLTNMETSLKNNCNDEFLVKYCDNTYEISSFFEMHPGGRRTLSQYKNLPLDRILKEVPHTDAAFHFLEEFRVDKSSQANDIENLIDWSAPLLAQVGSLGDRYWEWVNLPVNRSIRLFESNFFEFLTITPWYLVPMVWVPISVYFLYSGYMTTCSKSIFYLLPEIALPVSAGVLLWTLIEYVLHRNLFHLRPPADSKTLITLHFLLHGLHHKAPFDDQRLVFPPTASIIIAGVFYKIFKTVFLDGSVDFVAAGTMIGYLTYDLIHYYLHHGSPPPDSYLYVMKRYHNHHHFSHHDQGFGISNRLWDLMFGSLIRLKKLKRAIIW